VRISRNTEVKLGVPLGAPSAEWRLPRLDEIPSFAPSGSAFWQRAVCWLFLTAGITFYLLPAGRQTPLVELATALKTLLLVGGSSAVIIVLITRATSERSAGISLGSIKTKLPVEEACPVKVKIHQDGSVTGSDEGYVWLEEDTLFFKGTQCVFRINAQDVLDLNQWEKGHRPKSDDGVGLRWLDLKRERRKLSLRFDFLELDEDHASHKRASKLVRRLMTWVKDRPEGVVEAVLPPLAVHPGLLASGQWAKEGGISGWLIALSGAVLTFVSVLRLMSPGHLGISLTEAMVAMLGLAMTFVGVRFAVLQTRDREVRKAIALEEALAAGPIP
jgi:hypothetical protein